MKKRKKKRTVLRPWVESTLYMIMLVTIILAGADCNNIYIFLISKLIMLVILLVCTLILQKWGRNNE